AATRVLRENASIPWSDNVNVFASTTQDEVAFFYKDYTHQLANLLYRSDIHGLGTAQQYLEQNGLAGMYRIEPQLPVSTPGRYRAWDKRLECNRHVLLITGSGDGGPFVNVAGFGDERHFVSQARYLQQSLQDNFGLQDSQFTTLREPSRDDLHAALKDIQDRLHSDGELIIYFAAHGERIPYGTSQHAQGSHDGILSITEAHCLDEMEIKELVRHYCGHLSNVTIIVDACYGGAFIS
ncbi:MAG: caspase family protein, partial [Bdellovibrionales bacterium]|nr:caspase family protein [Bdellovibrionales bacterium]